MSVIQQIFSSIAGATGQGFRYWRIYVTACNSTDSYLQIQEIEFHTSIGGVDITTPAMTTFAGYTGSASELYPNARAFDNNFANEASGSWAAVYPNSGTHTAWVAIDLITPSPIAEVQIWPAVGLNAQRRWPTAFELHGSADGVVWSTIQSWTAPDAGWNSGTGRAFTV